MLLPETLKVHDREQFEFHFAYFLPWINQMVPSIEALGATAVCFKAANNLQMLLRIGEICRYVREHQIDIIHSHLPWAGIIARIVGKKMGVKVVYTEHNKWESYHKLTFWLNKLSFGWQQAAVTVSNDVQQSIRKNTCGNYFLDVDLNAKEDRQVWTDNNHKTYLLNILNGVDTDLFIRNNKEGLLVREALGIPAKAPVMGLVAGFRCHKRLDLWMEIAAEILQKVPEVHFIIVGDGMLKENLLAKRALLKIENRVHLPGVKTDVRPYLSAMDIYMMSSVYEGLPIALMEAMSCSCAVISTRAGGIGELVVNKKSGMLCEVDEYMKLVDISVLLLQNPEQRVRLAVGARARVVREFNIKKMVNQLEELYILLNNGQEKNLTYLMSLQKAKLEPSTR